jgi:hypothetical protein
MRKLPYVAVLVMVAFVMGRSSNRQEPPPRRGSSSHRATASRRA